MYRFSAGIALPLLILATLELALRWGGYGYDPSYFRSVRIGGQNVLVENDQFGFRFFRPEIARLPRPSMITERKQPNTNRIFVFGESAAEGDPDPAYGPARFLEVLLRERFPQMRFEIVNVSVTANNSHGILPIARECARLKGDLWIIYMGNNEMIGPFGAAGVFGRPAPPLTLIRANLALKETRLGQMLSAAVDYFTKCSTAAAGWGGLEMFAAHQVPPNDPSKGRVYRNFQRNLQDILAVAKDCGAKVILNTVAVNLKDCPPLGSQPLTRLSPFARASCVRLAAEAQAAEEKGDVPAAANDLAQAVAWDPQDAALQYRWGQCLLQMTNFAEARIHLQLACDNDALPARTDATINGLIRQCATGFNSEALALLEAPVVLATNNATGICGSETFYEHVHFNPNGSYRLGCAWAEQAAKFLPDATQRQAVGAWASQEVCERWLAMTDWNRRNDLNEMISRRRAAPLSGQSNNAQQLAEIQQQLAVLSRRIESDGGEPARQICLAAIERAPRDLDLRINFADYLEASGNIKEAAEQWRQVQCLRPDYFLGFFQEGRMQELLGELPLAKTDFQRAIALRPALAQAWYELGNIAASEGNLTLALRNVDRASQLQPQLPAYYACMGKILSRLGRHTDAVSRYRQALQVDANYWDGHMALGREWAGVGEWTDARTEFEAAIRLRPDSAPAHLELGLALARLDQRNAAQREAGRVLELDPGNQSAQSLLSQLGAHSTDGARLNMKD